MIWTRLFHRRKRMMDDLDQDIRDFIGRETQDNIGRGMPSEEARYAALRKFGNVTRIKEETREVWSFVWLEQLWQDVRFGLRMLAKTPGFTAVAVLTLALGIGSSTAIFSVVYPVFVDPYPYQGADRMVNFAIVGRTNGDARDWFSAEEFHAVRDQNRVFDGLVAYNDFHKVLSGENLPEVVFVTQMSGDAFQYFGVSPLLGRVFTTTDAPWGKSPAPVAVVSFRFWRRHYASAPNVVGRTLRLDGKVYTVIGVLPRRFAWGNGEIYLPYDQGWKYVWIGARLRPGVTLGRATADVNLIFQQLAKLHSAEYPLDGFITKVQRLDDWAVGSFRENLLLLVAAVGLLLLIACANAANLQLARGNARETEIVVRGSLGATRGRIIRQLLTENVTLSLVGGAFGVMIAYVGVRLIISIMPPYGIPTEAVIGVNGLALLFALVLSVAAGSASGLAPALRASKSNLSESLSHGEKGGTGSSGRRGTRNALIVSECAVALVLLVSAGLTFRSFLALRTVRLGFDPGRILTMDMPVNWGATAWQERVTVLNAILSRVQTLPGVEAAALSISTEPPPLPGFLHTPAHTEGAREAHTVQMNLVSPEFFRTFQVPLIRGRLFTEAEVQEGRQVAVVNRTMARLLWGTDEEPVGRQVHISLRPWEVEGVGTPPDLNGWCQVVGVVGDALNDGLQRPTQPGVYIPYSLLVHSETALAVRTASNPLALANAVRSAIASAGNGQPVTNVSRYSDYLADVTLSYDRFNAVLLLLFGALGMALCASGIYSVVWYSVSHRTHEIGIRMALGAQRGQVRRMVIRDMMTPVLIGCGLGLVGIVGLTRLAANQLFGVRPPDPITVALVSSFLGAVALFACYIPARRAMKVDPMVALRYE
ncbi:MAG: ADOP family duplicated permease [Terriglobia bacterium]